MGVKGINENAGEALRLLEDAHPLIRGGIERSDAWQIAAGEMCKTSDLTEQHMASIQEHLYEAAAKLAIVLELNESRTKDHQIIENSLLNITTSSLPGAKKMTESANRHLAAALGEEAHDLMGDPSPLQCTEQLLGQAKEAYDKARTWGRNMSRFHRDANKLRGSVAALAESAKELSETATANRVTPEELDQMAMQEPYIEASGVYGAAIETVKTRIEGINR